MSTFRSQQGRSQHGKTVTRMDILPPEPSVKATRVKRRGEVVDAQFVTVREPSRRGPSFRSHNDNAHRSTASSSVSVKPTIIERMVARAEKALMRLSADLFSAAVALVFVLVFSLAGGFSFLFSGSNTADASPILDITHVTLTPQDANGMRVLLISGIVENHGGGSLAMPSIRADLMSGEQVVLTTLITPVAGAIESGHSYGFSARVPHPGGKLPDLRLSFADRDASRS